MQIGTKGLTLIESFEGLRLVAYKLPGERYWTIGYGHTGPDVRQGMVINLQQALAYLIQDTHSASTTVNATIKVVINQNQFDALTSFTYNVGTGNFSVSSVKSYVNKNLLSLVPARLLLWCKDNTGKTLPGLLRRRQAEGQLFLEAA